MTESIPETLLAIADEVVRMELIRSSPVKCAQCKPNEPCWFCRPFAANKTEQGESA